VGDALQEPCRLAGRDKLCPHPRAACKRGKRRAACSSHDAREHDKQRFSVAARAQREARNVPRGVRRLHSLTLVFLHVSSGRSRELMNVAGDARVSGCRRRRRRWRLLACLSLTVSLTLSCSEASRVSFEAASLPDPLPDDGSCELLATPGEADCFNHSLIESYRLMM